MNNINTPILMSIPQLAATGLLTEYAIRKLYKEGRLPAFTVGKKVLINYDMLLEQLNNLGGITTDYAADYSVDFSGDLCRRGSGFRQQETWPCAGEHNDECLCPCFQEGG